MKKIIFLAVMALGLSSYAQVKFKFGVKAGVNLSSLNGKGSSVKLPSDEKSLFELENKTSFHAGAVAEIKFLGKFAVQPELLFSAQGAQKEIEVGTIKNITKQSFNYLNLPILFKYYPIAGLNLQFGPQVGFLLSADLSNKTTNNGKEISKVESSDKAKEAFRKLFDDLDFGLAFGAGYQLDNGLGLDARYILGLTDIKNTKDIPDQISKTNAQKNGVFQVSLNYFF